MKKILAVLLMIPVLLFGCSKPENSSQESTANTEKTVQIDESSIHVRQWIAKSYAENLRDTIDPVQKEDEEDTLLKYLHIDDRFEDEALQSQIADLNLTYPLSTDERMIEYVCATYNIFIENGYADHNMIPSSITHYSDGIWQIVYDVDKYAVGGVANMFRKYYEIFISELDGHVIDCICIDPAHEFDD